MRRYPIESKPAKVEEIFNGTLWLVRHLDISNQYIGYGKTSKEAREDAEKWRAKIIQNDIERDALETRLNAKYRPIDEALSLLRQAAQDLNSHHSERSGNPDDCDLANAIYDFIKKMEGK
jgi:hypothetical protein